MLALKTLFRMPVIEPKREYLELMQSLYNHELHIVSCVHINLEQNMMRGDQKSNLALQKFNSGLSQKNILIT